MTYHAQVTTKGASLTPDVELGRFTLTDLVEDRVGAQVWRAIDSTLAREVVLWVTDRDEALEKYLDEATRAAAKISDRRVVRILDVFATTSRVVVVTECVDGQSLGDHLAEPIPPVEAARIAHEVAGALESAHAAGIAHGRLRPRSVWICDQGEVRVSGVGIDAVISGLDGGESVDPVSVDVNGLGSLLYVSLTGRWPGRAVDQLPAAPEVGGAIPEPSRVLAEIPDILDDFCRRTIPAIRADGVMVASASQARELLAASLTDLTGERRPLISSRRSRRRLGFVGVALLLSTIFLGAVSSTILRFGNAESDDRVPVAAAASPSSSPSATAQDAAPEVVPISNAHDFDPLGNGEENPGRVPFAYDGDRNTAWRTVTYYNKSLDKPGVGVLFDLGAARTLRAVEIDLVGTGSDLQILTGTRAGVDPQDFKVVAQATQASDRLSLTVTDQQPARYVVLWFTELPRVDGGWRGGIREVRILS